MSDPSTSLLWLLSGGLFAICAGLVAALITLRQVLRKLADQSEKLAGLARMGADQSDRLTKLSPSPDLEAVGGLMRDEWQAFQAIYRADLATSLAEARLTEMQSAPETSGQPTDSLERAIMMARAGRSAKAIMAECGIGRLDAEALVHFHQPRRSLAG